MAYIDREKRIEVEAELAAANARCQKMVKPSCQKVCQGCRDAYKVYVEAMIKQDIAKAKELLEQWGYTIAD